MSAVLLNGDRRIELERDMYEKCCDLSYLMYKDDKEFDPDVFGNVIVIHHKISVCKPAYVLSYNEKEQIVYVGVRGTKDVNDVLTDALGVSIKFYDTVAHAGFVKSADYLFKKMNEALVGLTKVNNKKVIITGHSLGGAAAAAFAIKLKNEFPQLNLHCVTFGCPGVVSVKTAEKFYDYITAFINVGDVIPFACMKNICPMCKNATISVANFAKAMVQSVKEQPIALPLVLAINKEKCKLTSKWPLLVPPGRVLALGLNIDSSISSFDSSSNSPSFFSSLVSTISSSIPSSISSLISNSDHATDADVDAAYAAYAAYAASPNAKTAIVEIKDLRTFFECIPKYVKCMNHAIVFYGEQLSKALQ